MELRKDPITRSWVTTGDIPDSASTLAAAESGAEACAFCPTAAKPARLVASISAGVSPWSARSVVHPAAPDQVAGETTRRGDGL